MVIVNLVVIAAAAVVSPLVAQLLRRIGLPSVVVEISLGILVGPAVFGLISSDATVTVLANMGLSLLMFLAGYELELPRIGGRPAVLAGTGWLCSLLLAGAAAVLLAITGLVPFSAGWTGIALTASALTTTALGTLLPILRDSDLMSTRLGTLLLAVGSIGEFGPIVLVALLFGSTHPAVTVLVLLLFAALALGAGLLSARRWSGRIEKWLTHSLHTSTQLLVRIGLLVIVALVYLAGLLGLDVLLGAFAAGIVIRIAVTKHADAGSASLFRAKLEGIGFGLFVPVFFVVSGTKLPVSVFVHDPALLLRIPVFLVLLLLVRGTPALLFYRSQLAVRPRRALALFSATGLPFIVVITSIGTDSGALSAANAAALVGAGILSVVLLPTLGLRVAGPPTGLEQDRTAEPAELPNREGL